MNGSFKKEQNLCFYIPSYHCAQIAGASRRLPQRPNFVCKSKEPLFKFELGVSVCPTHWHDQRASNSVGVGFSFITTEVGLRDFSGLGRLIGGICLGLSW